MIHVRFSYTQRTPHHSSAWTEVHEDCRTYPDMEAALAAVKEQYWHVKTRKPVYQDTVSRGTIQTGWIYCYKDTYQDRHTPLHTIYNQDWVTFYEADYRAIDVTAKEN